MSKDVTMSSLWNLPIYHASSYVVDGQVLNKPVADKCAITEPEVKPMAINRFGKYLRH